MKRMICAAAAAAMMWAGVSAAAEARRDFNLQARAGVGGFTGELNQFTNAGPAWAVGFTLQPYRMLGVEMNYEGSRNQLDDARLTDPRSLMRHGASALVKVAPPFIDRIRPFAGLGLGVSYLNVDGNTGGLYRSDFVQEVPLAAGLEFNSGAVSAGFRATYRFLIDESFAANAAPGNPQGGLFDASVTVGARF